MRLRVFAATALFSVCVAACSAQAQEPAPAWESGPFAADAQLGRDQAVALFQQRYERLYDVWNRLITANTPLCANRGRVAGFTMHTLNSYPIAWREVVARSFALDAEATVFFVAPGSPAEAAGLLAGDKVLSINRGRIRAGKLNRRNDEPDRTLEAADQRLAYALDDDDPITLQIRREGAEQTISYQPATACSDKLEVRPQGFYAAADGESVVTASFDLVRRAASDDEVAIALAHNLAHNARQHNDRVKNETRPARWGRFAFGVLLGASMGAIAIDTGVFHVRASPRLILTMEREADYLGLYFAARAGFDTAGAEGFWRGAAPHLDRVHPTANLRCLNIAVTLSEIAAKRTAGIELLPNPAGAPTATPASAPADAATAPAQAESAPSPAPSPATPAQAEPSAEAPSESALQATQPEITAPPRCAAATKGRQPPAGTNT